MTKKLTTIRIGGVPEHFNLPWHMALEEGLFLQEGVHVEWVEFPEGTGAMNKALRAREIDAAVILTGGVIKDIANGNPSKIIQLYISSPLQWGVHVAGNSKLEDIAQLEHKIAAISRFGSGSHVMAYVQARQLGWDTSALQFEVVNTLEQAVAAISEGKADYFMWEHFTTKPIVDSGVFKRLGDFPTPWSCFVIAAHDEVIAHKKEALKKVLNVINRITADFKRIPSIDKTLSNRYEQKLEDITNWLSMTTWSQDQISEKEILQVQERLLDLKMIDNKEVAINYYKSL